MPARKRHSSKHIESALKYAESQGWNVDLGMGGSAHPWATVKCPYNKKTCRNGTWCRFGVWGTPSNPEHFAKKIVKAVDNCEAHKQQKSRRVVREE